MKNKRTSLYALLLAALTLAACSTTGGGSHSEVYGEIKSGYEVSATR